MNQKIRFFVCLMFLAACFAVTAAPAFGAENEENVRICRADACLETDGAAEEERFHILLIGQDERLGEPGKRSDSMILCTFCPREEKLILTSFLRDLYVKIPGYGYERINAAYALGGPELLDQTIEDNFGIRVDGNVEADFEHFSEIVDVLGGVTLTIREDEAAEINRLVPDQEIAAGEVLLNGSQALVYARIRRLDADSDFSRTERQRKLLSSLMDQNRDMSFGTLTRLMTRLLPAVTTDLSSFQILTYGKMILPVLKNLKTESIRVPDVGECQDQVIRGMQVLVPDLSKIRQKLQERLECTEP